VGKNFVEPATRAFSCLAKASVRVRRARQARRAERAGRRASSLLEDARRPVLSRRRKPTDAHGGFRGRAGRRKALMKQPFHLLKAPHAKISLCFQGYGLHRHLKTGDIPEARCDAKPPKPLFGIIHPNADDFEFAVQPEAQARREAAQLLDARGVRGDDRRGLP